VTGKYLREALKQVRPSTTDGDRAHWEELRQKIRERG
jgi:hypothetical protein